MKEQFLTMVLHGDAKAGKSTFAATAPGPVLVLDAEAGGMRFVPGKKTRWNPAEGAPPEGFDIYQVQVHKLADLQLVYQFLTQHEHGFQTVVFDSLTEIQARMKRDYSADGRMDMQGWGVLLSQMEDLIWQYRDIAEDMNSPVKVAIFITGSDMVNGKYRPLMQGAIRKQLPYKVDMMGYMDTVVDESGDLRRGLRFGGTELHDVGSRVPGIPSTVWDPDMSKLFDMVYP